MNDLINKNSLTNITASDADRPAMDEVADDFLDSLFAKAKQSQPELVGDNFTKVVLNSMPSNLARNGVKERIKRFLPDSVGLLAGLVVMSLIITPTQLLSSIVPSSITLSLLSVVGLTLGLTVLSVAAFFNVERNS